MVVRPAELSRWVDELWGVGKNKRYGMIESFAKIGRNGRIAIRILSLRYLFTYPHGFVKQTVGYEWFGKMSAQEI